MILYYIVNGSVSESKKSEILKSKQCFHKETMRKWRTNGSKCFKTMNISAKETQSLSTTLFNSLTNGQKSYDVIMTSFKNSCYIIITYLLFHNEYFWSVISLCI